MCTNLPKQEVPFTEKSRDNDRKTCVYQLRNAAPKSFFNSHSQKQITSFSYQQSFSFTHGSQHYFFLGQANFYRLCGLWQMSRQIWTIFLVIKRFQLIECKTQGIHERRNKEFRLVQNLTMGEADFIQFMQFRNQLVNAAESFATGEHLTPVLMPSLSKDVDDKNRKCSS